jgi:hypothetical protein
MSKSRGLRLGLVVALAAFAAAAIGSVARATSGSDNLNPTLLVTVSMVSNGSDPNVAHPGDFVTETMTVTNLSSASQYAHIYQSSDMPVGQAPNVDKLKQLGAGKSWTWTAHTRVKKTSAPGVYTIRVAAYGAGVLDPSAASATITIASAVTGDFADYSDASEVDGI